MHTGRKMLPHGEGIKTHQVGPDQDPRAGHTHREDGTDPKVRTIALKAMARDSKHSRPMPTTAKDKAKSRCHHCHRLQRLGRGTTCRTCQGCIFHSRCPTCSQRHLKQWQRLHLHKGRNSHWRPLPQCYILPCLHKSVWKQLRRSSSRWQRRDRWNCPQT